MFEVLERSRFGVELIPLALRFLLGVSLVGVFFIYRSFLFFILTPFELDEEKEPSRRHFLILSS